MCYLFSRICWTQTFIILPLGIIKRRVLPICFLWNYMRWLTDSNVNVTPITQKARIVHDCPCMRVLISYHNKMPHAFFCWKQILKICINIVILTKSFISDHTSQTVLEQVGSSLRTSECNNNRSWYPIEYFEEIMIICNFPFLPCLLKGNFCLLFTSKGPLIIYCTRGDWGETLQL
jgi:hypothetical protein